MNDNRAEERIRWNGKNTLYLWGPPVIVFLIILALSLTPGLLYPEHPEKYNVAVHFLEFVFLAFFLTRALASVRIENTWKLLLLTVSLCAMIGIMTEILQFTIPQRMFDVADILVDIFGAFTGAFLYINVMKLQADRQ
jgi:VanZ family protein